MNNSFFKMHEAFDNAVHYSKQSSNNCDKYANDYLQNDILYQKTTAKKIVLLVVEALVGALLLFFKNFVYELFRKNLQINLSNKFIDTILFGFGVVLLAFCGYSVFRIIYSINEKKKAEKIKSLPPKIQSNVDKMKEYSTQIDKALNNGEDLILEQAIDIETEILGFRNATNSVHKKSRIVKQVVLSVLLLVLTVISFAFFSKSISEQLFSTSISSTGYIMIVSYILFYLVLFKDMQHLTSYYGKKLKYGLLVLFLAFQGSIIFQLYKAGWFESMKTQYTNVQSEYGEFLSILTSYVLNYQTMTLILTTLMISMLIIMLDAGLLAERFENGVVIPMIGSDDVHMSPASIKYAIIWRTIIAVAFGLICSRWMAGIIVQGASFWRVVLYIVIGLIWGGVGFTLNGDTIKSAFGGITAWFKLSMFSVYALLTMSLLPQFGIGTIVLLALQYVVIFVAIFVAAFA